MENFMPTNLQGWIVVFSAVLGALGYLLKKNVKEPLDRTNANLEKLEIYINSRLDVHDNRLNSIDRNLALHDQRIDYLEKGD